MRNRFVFPLFCCIFGLAVFGVAYTTLGQGPGEDVGPIGSVNEEAEPKDLSDLIVGGDVQELEQALQNRADPNKAGRKGITPLQTVLLWADTSATAFGQVQTLLAHGASPNQLNNSGQTALHYAARHGVRESGAIMTILLEAGGDPNIVTYLKTPFEIALSEGNAAAVAAIERTTTYRPPDYARLKTEGKAFKAFMEGFDRATNDQDRKNAIRAAINEGVLGGLITEEQAETIFQRLIQSGIHRISDD